MAPDSPRIVRPLCPECGTTRTIQTATDLFKETFYCPECGHRWNLVIPPLPPS